MRSGLCDFFGVFLHSIIFTLFSDTFRKCCYLDVECLANLVLIALDVMVHIQTSVFLEYHLSSKKSLVSGAVTSVC